MMLSTIMRLTTAQWFEASCEWVEVQRDFFADMRRNLILSVHQLSCELLLNVVVHKSDRSGRSLTVQQMQALHAMHFTVDPG